MRLPPPATGAEMYLAAVLEELRAVRQLLEDGRPVRAPEAAAAVVPAEDDPFVPSVAGDVERPKPPAKRARTRAPRTAT